VEFGIEDFHIMAFGNFEFCENQCGESLSLYEGFDEILTLRSASFFLGGGGGCWNKFPIKTSHA
jgi:hypothetical protein